MSKRTQRRVKAVIPLKVTVSADGQKYLGHTVEISPSGARTILPVSLDPGTEITLEHKHRRCKAATVWSRPVSGRKYEYEIGLKLLNREQAFWFINLAMQEDDGDFSVKTEMHFERIWEALKHSK